MDAATTSAMHMLLKEAAAEGITTLASSGCNGLGSASYPGGLAQLVSVAAAPGITPAATATDTGLVIGGTGTFYDNGTSYGPYGVNNGQASATFTLSAAGGDTIVAVYSGDANNKSENSNGTTGGGGTQPAASTATTVSASPLSALASAGVTLTASVTATSASGSTTAGNPTGTVYLYDNVNGTSFLLGSASLGATSVNASTATLMTTALKPGANVLSASFLGSTDFTMSASTVSITVQISDYTVAFNPSAVNVTAGQSGKVTAAVSVVNGFTGQVVLGCTLSSGYAITCSFDNAVITLSSSSPYATLTVNTTVRTASVVPHSSDRALEAAAGAVGALLLGLLLPGVRRRRQRLLSVALLLVVGATLGSTLGCTELVNPATGSGLGSGTPAGTAVPTITTTGSTNTNSGSGGVTTERKSYTVAVNVQ